MNPAVQHTLRRHREILRDYGTEFRRARDNVQQQLQSIAMATKENLQRQSMSLRGIGKKMDTLASMLLLHG
ncbi:hypothetical protein TELCIR_09980 [Teladorsagia circumcincta]|uniref:Golgi SNAP receptor complex member 1 n=1 Tax=Teladorsagia circumcincta TaxID=45464 RepID=A0A2G9UDB9_TELCI|nr:hypothetical protein TELCIR_09980 [Teladorsagia circumcincta]